LTKRWTESERIQLRNLVKKGFTYPEIAKQMHLNRSQVAQQALYLRIKNPNYLNKTIKYDPKMVQNVVRFFKNHTREECCKKFALKESEFKSLFTNVYRKKAFPEFRKDKRRKDAWQFKEDLFLIQNLGIINRQQIAEQLKRGTYQSVKERLASLKIKSRNIHGLPRGHAILRWPENELRKLLIETKAGPISDKHSFHFKIILWSDCIKIEKKYQNDPNWIKMFSILLKFQKFIFQTNSETVIKRSIRRNLNAKSSDSTKKRRL
jgi:hypothetical protein